MLDFWVQSHDADEHCSGWWLLVRMFLSFLPALAVQEGCEEGYKLSLNGELEARGEIIS